MIHFPANTYTVLGMDGKVTTKRQSSPLDREQSEKLIGGPVEFVPLNTPHIQMLIPQEGRLLGLPFNRQASELAGRPVHGPALILSGVTRWQ